MSILSVENVSYSYRTRYRTVQALSGISCSFECGRTVAVVGKSGSGKTTLLSLLAALDLPDSGSILFDGRPTSALDRDQYRRDDVSVVYQSFNLFSLLTAQENVQLPMELRRTPRKKAAARAGELLLRVGLPETAFRQFPKMMSGGEQQRVAIARALATEARVVLADEPTGNLDSENGRNVLEILQAMAHQNGRCVIIVTHDAEIARQCDGMITMRDGKIHHLTPVIPQNH